MVGMPLYHVSAARNRPPIERWGLKARRPGEHNFPGYNSQPKGVYATAMDHPGFEHCPSDLSNDPYNDVRNLWRIDPIGLPIIADPVLGCCTYGIETRSCFVILADVLPERLTLVAQFWGDWPSKKPNPAQWWDTPCVVGA